MDKKDYLWTDNPAVSGVAVCDTDVLNDCMMHLKYNNTNGLPLFFMLTTDRALTGEEGVGWALQGSYVTMTYPDAVNMIINEYNSGVSSTYRGIACKRSVSGRYIADISKKDDVDELYATTGVADIYLVDTTNNAFYLPKTKWFTQYTTDINSLNKYNEAGLPNITGRAGTIFQSFDSITQGAFTIGTNGWDNKGSTGNSGYCFNFNASRSSAVYGKSSTVQPPSSNKFIYYKVGDVVAGATSAIIDAQEYLADSLNDIADAVADGISSISNASNALSRTQLTNCILEAPNGVATYSGTTITLKQGLKFLVPNGRNADGSLKNIEYVLSADTSYNAAVESLTTYTRNIIIFLGSNNVAVSSLSDNIPLYYQETQPSKFFAGFAYWYNTAENKVYYSNGNSVFTESLAIIIGSYTINSSAITALRTDKAVNLLKYSDLSWLTSLSLPSDKKVTLSIPGSNVGFRVVDDGYVQFHNEPGSAVTSGVYNQSSGLSFYTAAPFYEGFVPVKKGDNVSVYYSKLQDPLLTFIYATGAQE